MTRPDTSTIEREPVWDKPGAGTWLLDASHCGPAPGPIQRGLYEGPMARGFADGFAWLGSPLRGIEMRWVNGKFYRRVVPLIGADKDLRPPPTPVLWLATRLHPAFRRMEKRAKESFTVKRWREDLQRWDDEWKPSITKANLAFTDVDVASISDAELARHVQAVHAHLLETIELHFRLHVSDMGPLGDLMVHLERWGLEPSSIFRALVAASPATRAPAEQAHRLASALRDAGVDPATIASLDDIRAASTTTAALLEEYLRFNGWRLTTGYDLEDRCLAELPEVVVACVRSAAEGPPAVDLDQEAADALAALRAEVPPEHRATFDALAEDARLSYGLRDENGPITYEWPAGLLRRALLEAGRRLHRAGRIDAEGEIFDLSADEIVAVLDGGPGPDPEELRERIEERRWWATLDPPAQLGPDEDPPPMSALPPYLARITAIVMAVLGAAEAAPGSEPLCGTGIGEVRYVGTARVVRDAGAALATVEPGDVVVAPYTAPTYNAVLGLAGAIVTEEGGLLCHAAVIARELDLPAVVGAADAMDRISDGDTIEVDPVAGRVRVLG